MKSPEQEEQNKLADTLALIQEELRKLDQNQSSLHSELHDRAKYMWQELPQQVRTFDDVAELSAQLSEVTHSEMQLNDASHRRAVLEKMQEKPYFGRVDFREPSGAEETVYIGLANLMRADYTSAVCDWRTPVAGLFYENGVGMTSYEGPDGSVPCEVLRLRQYEIEQGELKLAIDSDVRIDDSILLNVLGGDSSDQMKTIVSTIQREQNQVIRDSDHELLLVLGPAGSGKTSIALHRVAYLLYRDRKKLKSKNVLIFSPNDLFSNYIAGVLPELGEDEAQTTTFADMIRKYCGVSVLEMYEQVEFLATAADTPANRIRRLGIRLKGSPEFPKSVRSFLENYLPPFRDLTFQGERILSAGQLANLYAVRYAHMNRMDRLQAIYDEVARRMKPLRRRYCVAKKEELLRANPSEGETHIDQQVQHAFRDAAGLALKRIRQFTEIDFRELYRKALLYAVRTSNLLNEEEKTQLTETVREMSLRDKLKFEDGVGVLLVMTLFGAIPPDKTIKQVVIDEVQDYSPAQHEIFAAIFANCSLTLLGDTNQLVNTGMGMDDGEAILSIYQRKSSAIRRLTKSYRSTAEIMELAGSVVEQHDTSAWFERHGQPVNWVTAENEREAVDAICDLLEAPGVPNTATAVITKTNAEARRLYAKCSKRVRNLILADHNRMAYERGRCIIPLALAKGMEFDRVILANSAQYGEGEGKLLYVALTRAMHELTVISVRKPSPLFASYRQKQETGRGGAE